MSIKRIQQQDGLEIHVVGVDSWDDFESLTKYLEKSFHAVVVERLDGVCSRTWKFQISGEEVILKHHDDLGNYFVCSEAEPKVLQQIATDLEQRLQQP